MVEPFVTFVPTAYLFFFKLYAWMSRILILAPHTDDGELGMGATIARFVEEGHELHYAAFSTADKSLPEGFPPGTLSDEVIAALDVLGVPKEFVHIYPYEVRTFSYFRQEILEDLIKLKREVNPEYVFIPTSNDLHQDHIVIANEGIRAFKKGNLMSYELPWNNLNFKTDIFYEIQETHLNKKIGALGCYKSQKGRDYMSPEFIRSLAKVRGVQISIPYAEAFEVVRYIHRL